VRALTVDELLKDGGIGAVINSTVPDVHYGVTRSILSAGKHAYSEKPLALSASEARKLVAEADRRGLKLACAPDTFLGAAAFVLVPLIDKGAIGPFAIVCAITGMGLGADLALPPALQADVVEFDTLRTGKRRAGLFFALWGMATKLSLALAVGLAFPALAAFGFDPKGGSTETGLLALGVIYAAVPVVLKVVAIGLVWNFPITAARQAVIRKRIEALDRRGGRN